jgi:hypothetical protein
MMSQAISLASFNEPGIFGEIDLGFKMPEDMEVKVWDDVNGNGIQDEGEPGIEGVKLQMIDTTKKLPIENIGGGSTCHEEILTNDKGMATFLKCPKELSMRVKVLNAPTGSIHTQRNTNAASGGTKDNDSDLDQDMASVPFSLSSFIGHGAYGQIDLGFKMPKKMVIRVWNDKNKNGLQDEGEEGIKDVKLALVLSKDGAPLPKQGENSNCDQELTTDLDGRVTFKEVPQGIKLKVKVVTGPANNPKVTGKNVGGVAKNQFNSKLNTGGLSDEFTLPNTVAELFDGCHLGYQL